MARKLGVEVVASAAQARQIFKSFTGDIKILEEQAKALNRALSGFQAKSLGSSNFLGKVGPQIQETRQQYQLLGNTIKVLTETSIQAGKQGQILRVQTTDYTANVQNLLKAQEDYTNILKGVRVEARGYAAELKTLSQAYTQLTSAQRQTASAAQGRITTATGRISNANQSVLQATGIRDDAAEKFRIAQSAAGVARGLYGSGAISEDRLNAINAQVALRTQALAAAEAELSSVTATAAKERTNATRQLVRAQATEAAAQAKIAAADTEYAAKRGGIIATARGSIYPKVAAGEGAISAAFNDQSQLPPVFEQLKSTKGGSPQLLRQLQRAGLQLNDATARESFTLERDLIRNVTRVNGAFTDHNNILNRVSAEYDKSGRVITRFGGQMSGIGSILNQIGRDFQKVIEFAIATTVVFGALSYSIQEISRIKEIDKSLRQFSITANLTKEQTKGLFEGLSAIAISTATPLTEIVKAADDIALATRKAGQSTQDWQRDILSLTNSVGILTNLAGIDTVKATDLLVSSMKQLNLAASDLPIILSKITAVAGGQSAAISDIIQGLGVMAEAGKQGGLNVDQMIAAVQTLSQVTSKSPAEVATSFKNLVGSLASPGSIKQLDKYNINLRDSAGNLRNILSVYQEISDKIKGGIIPADRIQELVRGISGGPRRAPDAAALLGAIDTISQVTAKSIGATNEALIANAKILDTSSAKTIQLQAKIDKFATTKFSEVLNDSLTALVDVLDKVLGILDSIPTGLYVGIIQFGLMGLAVKSLLTVFKYIGGTIGNLRIQFAELTATLFGTTEAFVATAAASKLVGPNGQPLPSTLPGPAGPKGSKYPGLRGGLAGSALFGAGSAALTLASGGSGTDALASGLQSAGITGLLLLPGPFKLIGAAATVAGFALQFFSDQEKKVSDTNVSAARTAEQILDAYTRLKDATDTLGTLGKSQNELSQSITALSSKSKKTTEDLSLLSSQQTEYIDNIIKMADATNQLAEAQKNISDVAPGFAEAIAAARAGTLSEDDFQKQVEALQLKLLQATNPNITDPNAVKIYPPVAGAGTNPYRGPTSVPITTQLPNLTPGVKGGLVIPGGFETTNISLQALKDNYKEVQLLFADTSAFKDSTSALSQFIKAGENIDGITAAIEKAKAANEPWAQGISDTWQMLLRQNDALAGAQLNLDGYAKRIEAISQLNPTQGASLAKLLDLTKKIVTEAGKKGDSKTIYDSQNALFALLNTSKAPTQEQILPFVKTYADLIGATKQNISENVVLQEVLKALGLDFDILGKKGVGALGAISDENIKVQENLDKLVESVSAGAANKLAGLQAQKQSGDFKGNGAVYNREIAQQKAIIASVTQVSEAYKHAAGIIPNLDDEVQNYASALTKINGLQDAQHLTTDQLISRMFDLANTYGLTGAQVDQLAGKMINLIGTVERISAIKAKFHIEATVNLAQAIAALKALRAAQKQTTYDQYGHYNVGQDSVSPGLEQAIKELEAAQGIGTSIDKIFAGGNPNNLAIPKKGSSKKGSGLDVSNLDLPDEIANASNRSDLIQEAIRRAKKLQSQIPGANKDAKNDIVELLKGTQRILEVRGVKDDLLRKALQELADIEKKKLEFETKADTIRRIRVGAGSFAAIANVPVNSTTGVSLGGPNGPINVTLNINGTVLTPAQLAQFADLIAASIKRQIANG